MCGLKFLLAVGVAASFGSAVAHDVTATEGAEAAALSAPLLEGGEGVADSAQLVDPLEGAPVPSTPLDGGAAEGGSSVAAELESRRAPFSAGGGCASLNPLTEIIPSAGVSIIAHAPEWVTKVQTSFASSASWATMSEDSGTLNLRVLPNENEDKRVAIVSISSAHYECTLHITQDSPKREADEQTRREQNLNLRFIFGHPSDCEPKSECAKAYWGA